MKRWILLAALAALVVVGLLFIPRKAPKEPTTAEPADFDRPPEGRPSGVGREPGSAPDATPIDAVAPETSEQSSPEEPAGAAAPTSEPPGRTVTRGELEQIDIEAEERARRERVEAYQAEHGGPIACETVCDCPTGLDCQLPPGICVPATRDVYCCTDPGCPADERCVHEDGRAGVCGR